MSDYGDYFMDDGPQFGDEFAVFERVGMPGSIPLGLTGLDGKQIRGAQDPLDKFQIEVDAISRNLGNYDNARIDNDDIKKLLDTARKFQDTVMYKNPYAYILGFIASQGGKNITKSSFDNAVKLIGNIEGGSVRPEDVLRYARFWIITLS